MPDPSSPLYSSRCELPRPLADVYQLLEEALATHRVLGGTPRDRQHGSWLRLDHPGGLLVADVEERNGRASVAVKLLGETLERPALDAFSRAVSSLFADLEARLGISSGPAFPWQAVHAAPGTPPRVLRRSDLAWQTAAYADAPEDTQGEMAALTGPLGVTQFGADLHRLAPGERNCRHHAEVQEQEAFLVLEGACHLVVEDQVIELGQGDLGVTFPGEAHFFFNAGDVPCEVLTFGGPTLFPNACTYPLGRDDGWRERLQGYFRVVSRPPGGSHPPAPDRSMRLA